MKTSSSIDHKRADLVFIFGFLFLFIIIIFFIIAYIFFPFPINMMKYFPSDFGRCSINPLGCIFFNLGCIISSIFLFPFFYYSSSLYKERKIFFSQSSLYKEHKRFIILSFLLKVFGFYASISLFLVGIFTKDHYSLHLFWTANFVGVLIITITILSFYLYKSAFTRIIGIIGFIEVIFFIFVGIGCLYIIFFYDYFFFIVIISEWVFLFSAFFILSFFLTILYFNPEKVFSPIKFKSMR